MSIESVDILIQRSHVLRSRNVSQALLLLDDALAIARKADYKKGIATIHHDMAICFLSQQSYKKALTYFNDALHQFEELNDKKGILSCLTEISSIYFKLGDCLSSLNYVLESLKINTELDNTEGIAADNNELGKLYIHLQQFEKAIEHFKKALKIFETAKNKKEMVNSYFLLGNAYNWMDDFDKAHYYLLRSVNAIEHLDDYDAKAKTIGSLAILYTKKKEYEKALSYFNDALKIAGDGASTAVKAQLKKSLGNLYIELTQFDKAIEVLNSALKIAQVSPVESQLVKIHQFLSLAYEKIGDYHNALIHYQKFYELDKALTSEEVNLKSQALHIKFDLEELQKQKEIAVLSDKLKEQFLANVSHEIRTPMNGVLGMTHLLEQTKLSPEQNEYINAIKVSANNLMLIINDILDFSKINAGKIEFNEQEFNLRDLIKGIMQILQVRATEKRIKMSCKIDFHVKEILLGDPIRLNQILTNLMGNAVKFTEKGKVTLDVKLIEMKNERAKIKFSVIDTGIGIPENKLVTIFESFEQVESRKKRYEGTGLGLTIVKQLVELQGGKIYVKSLVDEGSQFIFEMSFKVPEHQRMSVVPTHVSVSTPDKNFSKVKILIVEDNKINQLLVKNMLKNSGFVSTETAENGKVALEKLEKNNYDIILMDIQMPEMDGFEITAIIRQKMRAAIRNVPIIALTADASETEKTKAREAGMNDYVVKPYSPEELHSTILKYLPDSEIIVPEEKAINHHAVRLNSQGMSLDFLSKYTGGDQELTMQLIEIFLQQVPEAIQKLEKYIPAKDWKHVHAVSHKVKSSIAIFEFFELKKLMAAIEEYSRDQVNLEDIPGILLQFKMASNKVMLDLKAELHKLKLLQS